MQRSLSYARTARFGHDSRGVAGAKSTAASAQPPLNREPRRPENQITAPSAAASVSRPGTAGHRDMSGLGITSGTQTVGSQVRSRMGVSLGFVILTSCFLSQLAGADDKQGVVQRL
jgi:hypothetical protein